MRKYEGFLSSEAKAWLSTTSGNRKKRGKGGGTTPLELEQSHQDAGYSSNYFDWFNARHQFDNEEDQAEYEIQRARSVFEYASNLETAQREVHDQHLLHAQLYSNRQLSFFDWGSGAFTAASMQPVNTVNENIVKSTIDTFHARVSKQRPKATPISRGGSFKLRRNTRKLDKFLWGETLRLKLFAHISENVRTAAIYGFGGLHFEVEVEKGEDGEAKETELHVCEVFPDEIIVDEREAAATGSYSHLYWRRVLPVETVAAKYGVSHSDLISNRITGVDGIFSKQRIGEGFILVIEAYLRSRCGLPGRHIITAGDIILKDEVWEEEWLPFAFFHYQHPGYRGFYTPSMAESCLPFQIRYNEISDAIRESENAAKTYMLLPIGSQVNVNQLRSRRNFIVHHTPGLEPKFSSVPIVDIRLYDERRRQEQQCLTHHGLTDYSQGALPGGTRLDSSRALNEYNAIQEDRLFDVNSRLEAYYLEVYQRIVEMTAKFSPKAVTRWTGGSKARVEVIRWDEIDLEKNCYVLQLGVSNAFAMGPAVAKDELMSRLMNGIITPQEYKEMLSNPDFEATDSLASAAKRANEAFLERLEEGEHPTVYPEMDLAGLSQLVTLNMLLLSDYDDVPDEVMIAHREALLNIKAFIEAAQAPPENMDMPLGSELAPGMAIPPADPNALGLPPPGNIPDVDMSSIFGAAPEIPVPGQPPGQPVIEPQPAISPEPGVPPTA